MPQSPISAVIAAAMVLHTGMSAAQEKTVQDWSWIVDHYEQEGQWISACDHRNDNGTKFSRCYISLVDVFAPRPQFGAAFVFVTAPTPASLRYEFRFEPGTVFAADGFALIREGKPVWHLDTATCPDLKCVIEAGAAQTLASQMSRAGELRIAFSDTHGRAWERHWPNAGFAAMLADFRAALARRGL